MRRILIKLICISMIVVVIVGSLIVIGNSLFDGNKQSKSENVISSKYPRLVYGKVVEK